jgi:uncharacterized C2H2 Zn-finger protein
MATSTTAEATTGLVCPECGKTFVRAQGLAAHRRQAHGVIGSSKATAARRRATTTGRSSSRPASRRASAATASPAAATANPTATATPTPAAKPAAKRRRTSRRTAATNGTAQVINRDALLALVYPNGIPARENVIRAVSSWLAEAERLARER